MKRFEQTKSSPVLEVAVWAGVLGVFAADLAVPLGIAVWILYLVPLALTLYEWRPRLPLLVAAGETALLVAGYFLSTHPPTFLGTMARLNRAFGAVTIWGIALVARQFIVARLNLRE